MHNLYVGNECTGTSNSSCTPYGSEATGMQDETMLGACKGVKIYRGTTKLSNSSAYYSGSIVEGYVNNYKSKLEANFDIEIKEARLITKEELNNPDTFACIEMDSCSDRYPWVYSTTYWTGSARSSSEPWHMYCGGGLFYFHFNLMAIDGVRPVIIISKDYF